MIGERPLAARQTLERGAHPRVGVVGERPLRVVQETEPPRVRDLHEPDAAAVVRAGLREQVTLAFVRRARSLQQPIEDIALQLAPAVEQ